MTTFSLPTFPTKGWGLKRKLIVSMLLVGVVPLLLGLSMAFLQGSKEIQVVSGESFQALATEAARKLDLLVAEEVARTSRIAVHPDIVRELERRRDMLHAADRSSARPSMAQLKARWEARDPAVLKALTENSTALLLQAFYAGSQNESDLILPQVVRAATKKLFITDVQGNLFAALSTKPSFAHAESEWWKGTFNKGVGQLYIEDLHFDDQANTYVVSISLPIMDSLRYEVVGVLHRVIDAKEFFSPATHPIRFGRTGHVMLIDSRGIVLSCPILPTGVRLSDPALIPHVTTRQPGWVTADSDGHGGNGTAIIGFAPPAGNQPGNERFSGIGRMAHFRLAILRRTFCPHPASHAVDGRLSPGCAGTARNPRVFRRQPHRQPGPSPSGSGATHRAWGIARTDPDTHR